MQLLLVTPGHHHRRNFPPQIQLHIRSLGHSGVSAYGEFFEGLVRDPARVSAPTPSSRALANAIAAKVDPRRPGLVVELGAGTGVITDALIANGVRLSRLVLFEQGGHFANLLRRRFPWTTIIEGDAFEFRGQLAPDFHAAAVVSGLPLLNFPVDKRRRLIEDSFDVMDTGGRFVQLSYGWTAPIAQMRGAIPEKTLVWRNLPPAHIWTYQKK